MNLLLPIKCAISTLLIGLLISQASAQTSIPPAPAFGPQSSLVSDEAFAPARTWQPGMAGDDRTRIVIVGSLFSLAAIGCTLLRTRRGVILSLSSLVLASSAGIIAWQRSQPTMQSIHADVIVVREAVANPSKLDIAQVDRWQYYATRWRKPVPVEIPLADGSMRVSCEDYPITVGNHTIGTAANLAGQTMSLNLRRGDRVAILTRTASDANASAVQIDQTSLSDDVPFPLRQLARGEYPTLPILGVLKQDSSTSVVVLSKTLPTQK